ncbi:hypothetical protein EAM01S_13_00660 [Erwinia amylovora NBRC 12687 = CFBP 1232]|nr:hypothetical protein EAM01S_13_00660 [Erwinia amylovora NBRC 12687 = CFBP 1232]
MTIFCGWLGAGTFIPLFDTGGRAGRTRLPVLPPPALLTGMASPAEAGLPVDAELPLIMPDSFPPTELIGACVSSLLEQPASQNPTSEMAAIRRNLKTGLPMLIDSPITAILL